MLRNYISVNAKYYKASHISKIYKHNQRLAHIDYLLNDKDKKFTNLNYSINQELSLEDNFKDQFDKNVKTKEIINIFNLKQVMKMRL